MTRRRPDANPVYSANGKLSNALRIYGEGSPEVIAARLDHRVAVAEQTVRRLVGGSPPLPGATRLKLAAILLDGDTP